MPNWNTKGPREPSIHEKMLEEKSEGTKGLKTRFKANLGGRESLFPTIFLSNLL